MRGDDAPPAAEPQLFVSRTVRGDEATWVLTVNRFQLRYEGPGCCPPCPCDGHNCAPCVLKLARGVSAGVPEEEGALEVTLRAGPED